MYSNTGIYSFVLPKGVSHACAYVICSSNWCVLYSCLCSLLGLQGRAGHWEDIQLHGVEQQSGSWRNRIQWLVVGVVQQGDRSLTCLQAGEDCTRTVEFIQSWGESPVAGTMMRKGRG